MNYSQEVVPRGTRGHLWASFVGISSDLKLPLVTRLYLFHFTARRPSTAAARGPPGSLLLVPPLQVRGARNIFSSFLAPALPPATHIHTPHTHTSQPRFRRPSTTSNTGPVCCCCCCCCRRADTLSLFLAFLCDFALRQTSSASCILHLAKHRIYSLETSLH